MKLFIQLGPFLKTKNNNLEISKNGKPKKKMEKADFSMESGVYGVGMLGGRGR